MAAESVEREAVTLDVAAKALGVSVRTVRRYVETGRLGEVRDGGKLFVRSLDVRILRESMKNGGIPKQASDPSNPGLTTVTGVTSDTEAEEGGNGSGEASDGNSDNLDSFDTVTLVKPASDTITLTLSRYDELVSELAALKNQHEYLIEYKADAETIRETVFAQEHTIGRLEGQLQILQATLAQPKQSFWRRLWRRAKSLD